MSRGDVAIIGMAGRFPGAATLAEYWANVRDGVESIRRLTDEELLAAGVSQADLDDPSYVKACPVLDDIELFDATFFGFSPRDASVMDPAHRLFLEVAWEAMEHAGHTALPEEGPVGVFATSGAPYYLMDNVRRNRALMRSMGEFLVRHTNNDMNFLATRVSYEMDLRGPSVNIQTACSSALVSVHMACESIRNGDCVMAIAGGSTVNVPARQGYMYQEGEILSPDGHCRPFDEKSAGTVFGSGSGCVVLKELSKALDDGDTIHAVIKGSAINNDGAQRVGYLAPGVEGQAAVVARALDAAAVAADSISYIEAHGTGTSVGDPIEVEALNQAFRKRTTRRGFCAIGSVKSNIGHLGEAAGIAALIKAVMALEHRQLPPSLGYERPNPRIDFDDSPFFVNDRLRPWQGDGPLRCGITALGAGGTNCHMVVEEAPERIAGEGARDAQLLVLSARTPDALEQAAENLADALEADPATDLADAAYTLAVGRRPMSHRRVVVARDRAGAVAQLRERDPKQVLSQRADDDAGSVVFMFPGGGAQYPRMGIELFEHEPVYRSAVEACLAIANRRLGRDLAQVMFADAAAVPEAARELERPTLSLPSLFTTEYALATLFRSWGVEPAALLGHSMGEYVAACLAGVMKLDEALELVMLRGRLFEAVPRGRMLSVPISESDLRALMPDGLSIAAVNAPELCVASGPASLIEALERTLAAREVESTRVRIDVAAHSAMLDDVLAEFRRFCRTIAWQPPTIPFLSNVSGTWITAAEATDPEYWVKHLRSTVRFADCLETLHSGGDRVLLEVGPGRTLSTLGRAQRNPARHAITSMRHADESTSAQDYALRAIGRLWLAGIVVEWAALYDGQLRNRIPLPTYAWDHQRHWLDAPAVTDSLVALAGASPDGARRDRVEQWFERPSWAQTPPPPALSPADERVLVFADAAGFGDAMAAGLASNGRRVSIVRAGSAWAHVGDEFTIRPAALADYEQLLKALISAGGLPQRVIHTWCITEGERPASVDSMQENGFHSLLCFAQALSNEDADVRLTLDVVTNNLQRIGGEVLLEPAKALVLGPARVMPREFLNVRSRAVDVVLPLAGSRRKALAGLVAAEAASDPTAETIAFRGLDRYAQTLEPVAVDGVASRLKERGVYLITGGLGGIGYTLAEHLAAEHRARLVLIGRGATAARARSRIAALEARGAEVEVIQADVTNAAQMRDAVGRATERFGPINGVFHSAGTLGDSLMALKTREDADRVLAPKVHGTLALDAALGETSLDLFVLFSSISSVGGLAGQADYSAANAFLDAFAHERSARDGTYVVSVNWSGWREVGMAANIASGSGGGSGVGDEVHPVLGRRISSTAEAELFTSELSTGSHWVVGEHRLRGGSALMPGTGYLEIARAALEARPEPRVVEIRDMAFMSPLIIPDTGSREMRAHLARSGAGGQALVIAGRVDATDGSHVWQEHVTATVAYVDADAPARLDLAAIAARCTLREETFTSSQASVNMDFGPRWKNVRSMKHGRGEALLSLTLPAQFVGDLETYPLHPALMDMATGRGDVLIPGFDQEHDFYVPLSYTRLRMFAPLTSTIYSHIRVAPNDFDSTDFIVFDATITDETGRVLVVVDEYVMTRVTDRGQLDRADVRAGSRRPHATFEPSVQTGELPPLVRWLEDGIRPREGMEALDRILSGPALPQIFATPRPVRALLAEMRAPQVHAPAPSKPAAAPVVRFPETEARLEAHPAVARAIVLERFDRPGNRHVVGYILPHEGEHATVSELRRFVKKDVPVASVPGTILLLETLPLDASGAVDIGALHDPFGLADDYIAPRTETEILLAGVWKEALGVDKVGVRDNFFDIGGHSLLAVRAVVKLDKAVGVRLNQAIMVLQTLEQIAAEVDRQRAAKVAGEAGNGALPDSRNASDPTAGGAAPGRLLQSIRNAVAGKTK